MASIWNSHQRCSCGWRGITRSHRFNIISGLGYVTIALGVVALEAFKLVSLSSLSWAVVVPAIAIALVWYRVAPQLLWKRNACPKCGAAMEVDLIAGKPAPETPSPK